MKKKFLIVIIVMFLVSGCSYRELNDLAIVTSLGVDLVDGKYLVSAQIMDMQKSEGEASSESTILYKGYGNSILDALRNIMKQYPRTIYLGHLELMVLGREILEEKINEIFDYFISSPECPNDFMIFANMDGLALDIVDPSSSNSGTDPAKDILSSLENAQKLEGSIYEINFEEFLAIYLEKGKDPVIPVVKFNKSEDADKFGNIFLTSLVPFKDNVLGEVLSDKSAFAFNTLNNNYYDSPVKGKYKGKDVVLLLMNPKSSIDLNIKDKDVNVDIKVKLEGHASEVAPGIFLTKDVIAKEIEDIFEGIVYDYIEELIVFCKDYDVDILGLKSYIYKHYYKQYDSFKDKNIYDLANININVDINLYRYGNTYIGVGRK